MTRQEVAIITFILVLLIGNIFFAGQYLNKAKELKSIKQTAESYKINVKIINFFKLFIEKVLKSENEVDFETRLKLENAVRNTGNKDIVASWQQFIESKTESEAQQNIKGLLEILVDNIQGQ